jgi:hypothetical protein
LVWWLGSEKGTSSATLNVLLDVGQEISLAVNDLTQYSSGASEVSTGSKLSF